MATTVAHCSECNMPHTVQGPITEFKQGKVPCYRQRMGCDGTLVFVLTTEAPTNG